MGQGGAVPHGRREPVKLRRPLLAAHTAIFVTTDEGGGYYDSGYVQPLTFFGDGPGSP